MIQSVAMWVVSKKFVYWSALALGVLAIAVDPTIFAAAVVTVITAVTGSAVIVINALASAKKELLAQQQAIQAQQQAIQSTVETVKHATDGISSTAIARRNADEETILSLRQQLSDSETRARLMAQATTNRDIAIAVPATKPQTGVA